MGFYTNIIFPWMCDLALDRPPVAELRRHLLCFASGNILEIGLGTGLNLPCYPKHVHKITSIDPNVGMHRRARKRIHQSNIIIERHILSAEQLSFCDLSFDCVVSTFTLCSIPNVQRALSEVFRVLKTGGRFLFLEHGLSPNRRIQKWQHRLNWLQVRLGDGCHLNRDFDKLVATQPFASVKTDHTYLEQTPKTHGYLYQGIATK